MNLLDKHGMLHHGSYKMAEISAGILAVCRFQVVGGNLVIIRKPLALTRNVQAVDLACLLHDALYNCSVTYI